MLVAAATIAVAAMVLLGGSMGWIAALAVALVFPATVALAVRFLLGGARGGGTARGLR